jgi:hypothetical protein
MRRYHVHQALKLRYHGRRHETGAQRCGSDGLVPGTQTAACGWLDTDVSHMSCCPRYLKVLMEIFFASPLHGLGYPDWLVAERLESAAEAPMTLRN